MDGWCTYNKGGGDDNGKRSVEHHKLSSMNTEKRKKAHYFKLMNLLK